MSDFFSLAGISGFDLLWSALATLDFGGLALTAPCLVLPLLLMFSVTRHWRPKPAAWSALTLLPLWLAWCVNIAPIARFGFFVSGAGCVACFIGALVQLGVFDRRTPRS